MHTALSLYLDLIRFLAAALVFVIHANYERLSGGLPLLWRLKDLGNDAVMVFFVLSGFVIAYVADQKENTARDYLLSRIARLYSVAVPAVLLTVALDAAGTRLAPELYDGWWYQADQPLWRAFANLAFINELWSNSVRLYSNGPFWSLSYEWWYYLIFAAFWYQTGWRRWVLTLGLGLLAGPKILLLLPCWLLGALSYQLVQRRPLPGWLGWLLFIAPLLAYMAFRQFEGPRLLLDSGATRWVRNWVMDDLASSRPFLSNYVVAILVALHFIGATVVTRHLAPGLQMVARPIRYLAGYSFALYLFHYPALQFFAALGARLDKRPLQLSLLLLGTLGLVWAVGSITETRKKALRQWLDSASQRATCFWPARQGG